MLTFISLSWSLDINNFLCTVHMKFYEQKTPINNARRKSWQRMQHCWSFWCENIKLNAFFIYPPFNVPLPELFNIQQNNSLIQLITNKATILEGKMILNYTILQAEEWKLNFFVTVNCMNISIPRSCPDHLVNEIVKPML